VREPSLKYDHPDMGREPIRKYDHTDLGRGPSQKYDNIESKQPPNDYDRYGAPIKRIEESDIGRRNYNNDPYYEQ
jgi:hypothetical protein